MSQVKRPMSGMAGKPVQPASHPWRKALFKNTTYKIDPDYIAKQYEARRKTHPGGKRSGVYERPDQV